MNVNEPIDIVLTWVDNNDENWNSDKMQYEKLYCEESYEASNVRFQSWDNLKCLFRAIEKNMPWINKVFFITCGHYPDFLDLNCKKLRFVSHKEYIPEKYLPTFNSNTIEMNIHRIEDLSENFILFNDDMFPICYQEEEYYFKNNMVCDEAVENIITTSSFGSVSPTIRYAQVNNMFVINKYFKKAVVQKKNYEKWFCLDYEERLQRTKSLEYWYDFPGFYDPHLPSAMKKSTLSKLWDLEEERLNNASMNRFRAHSDLTQYLIRYWQLCEGMFLPRKTRGKVFFLDINNYMDVVYAINNRIYPMICINECCSDDEFEIIKSSINDALDKQFPDKSIFEV